MWSILVFFFFKQKTAYEMRISDWSSDVCSSDLPASAGIEAESDIGPVPSLLLSRCRDPDSGDGGQFVKQWRQVQHVKNGLAIRQAVLRSNAAAVCRRGGRERNLQHPLQRQFHDHSLHRRSEEHTSELQSLMRIS